jgi:WD40 repeat protein/serine/threonine protein kinase
VLPAIARLDSRQLGRFQREARSAARLHHTNIVPVFGVGEQNGLHYYVMQFIQGLGLDLVLDELRHLRQPGGKRASARDVGSTGDECVEKPDVAAAHAASAMLSGVFPRKSAEFTDTTAAESCRQPPVAFDDNAPPPAHSASKSSATIRMPGQSNSSTLSESGSQYWLSVARVGVQVADALAYAATQGILHRDIKPSNLLLDESGNVWVTDFGLAKAVSDGDDLTHTGDVVGTLRYMAPERFNGRGDIRSDVYSLGLTLYELLTLRPAFDETDRNKLVKRLLHDEPLPPRKLNSGVPRDLETVVLKATARDPGRRYQTPAEMADDLKRFVEDRPVRARRTSEAEKLWRWCRRNPGIALLGSALATVLIAATAVSLLAAGHFNRLRLNESQAAVNERFARHEAEQLRQAESRQRQLTQTEKSRADIMLADMYASRGLLAGERNAPAEAALWFAAAAEQSSTAENPQRERDNSLRARNWMRRATLPVASMLLSSQAQQLEFQPHGDVLLVRFGEDQALLWSWRRGHRLPWAEGLAGVSSAQFSPDGAVIALGHSTGAIHLRRVLDGHILATIRHNGFIGAVAFSPDGKYLAVASNSVRVWDIAGNSFLDAEWSHPQPVTALAYNRKGNRLITTCSDRRARVFSMESEPKRKEALFAPVAQIVRSSPALIDDDRCLVTVTGTSELTRWDLSTGKPTSAPVRTQPRNLEGVSASVDGRWFVTGGYYGPELFATDGKRAPTHLGHTNLVTKSIFSPDNTTLLSIGWDQTARLWSLPDAQLLGEPLKHMAIVNQCAWSHDSRFLATAQHDGLLRVWRRGEDSSVGVQESGWGERPRLSGDGRLVVPGLWHESALGGQHQNVRRVRVLSCASGSAVAADIDLPGTLIDSCICGDNLAVANLFLQSAKGRIGVWDVATGSARFQPIDVPGLPVSIAARPNHGQLAVLCSKGELLVVDDKTGNIVLKLEHEVSSRIPAGRNAQVQYTADGKLLVSIAGCVPHTINVRDADGGRLRFAIRPSVPDSNLHSFSLSADGKLLATLALVKNSVQVWDMATGQALSEPLSHPGDFWGLFSVRFSPDGQRLITSHKDGQVRYWDWKAGKLACPPMPHEDETHDAVITPDGRYALTVMSGRPELHVWELKTGRHVAPPVRLGSVDRGFCRRLALTHDGRRAMVCFFNASSDTNLAVVDLDSLLTPCTLSSTELALRAELATGRRIELGDLSALTTEQWQQRSRLLQTGPDAWQAVLSNIRIPR